MVHASSPGEVRETPLPGHDRDALRARTDAEAPGWYSPWGHLAAPSIVGLAVITWAAWVVESPSPWELLVIPLVFVLSNAVEWRAHRDLLHKRHWLAPVLYDRHTPVHHMLFLTEDMEVRSTREWRMVLIPPYGILLIAAGNFPLTLALWHAGLHNVAALYIATALAYVVLYEWLHLSFHQPVDGFVGRRWIVRALRDHHAIHHDPRLMQRWNFNVVFPLWDLIRRTHVSRAEREARFGARAPTR